MAENSRQTQSAPTRGDACENAPSAHIERWAHGDPAAVRDVTGKTPTRRKIRAGLGRGTVWGGDQDDPRLFYFRALLAGGRFFSGGKARASGRA
jgi:hypothetical protein